MSAAVRVWRRHLLITWSVAAVAIAACQSADSVIATTPAASAKLQRVRVTVDGVVAFGAPVTQGGADGFVTADQRGEATLQLDPSIAGDPWIIASFPSGRARAVMADPSKTVEIDLKPFSNVDDPTYRFDSPGRAGGPNTAAECAHCHGSIAKGFEASAHSTSASNPRVHDLYAGTAAARTTDEDCARVGGVIRNGRTPGNDALGPRCYVGDAAIAIANPSCKTPPCDVGATAFAGCADCHAPGIDGALGGRDLLEARGAAFDSGVFCDVCHKVEGMRELGPPGVAGKLRLVRPSEPGPGPGGRLPLTFGPFGDVGLVRMGSVARTIFKNGELCTGCHEQSVSVAATPRAPDGKLAVDTTSSEWRGGPMAGMPCQSCHGDKLAGQANAVGVDHDETNLDPSTGWPRAPGSIHDHAFSGPRGARNIGALALSLELISTATAGALDVTATVTNRGAGHALPSGEAMRAMFVVVDATCDGAALSPTGGDVVQDIGAYLDAKPATADVTRWPGATAGERLRVVRRTGEFRDYDGPGAFAKGGLAAGDKGLPVEDFAGERIIVGVAADGAVTLDAPLPGGDVVYRVEAATVAPPRHLAGAPGFAFARVLTSDTGQRQVPHFLARDVAFDDRLPPGRAMITKHRFAAPCAVPKVRARLLHRPYPLWLAEQRGWPVVDRVVVEVKK